MASLQRHVVRGRTYWRIVESRRINGKPRPVPVMYLGTADSLLNRLLEAPSGRLRIRSFQHGDVAALLAAADRLGVVSIIDRHVPERKRGVSIGTTLLLGALNRAIRPRSKRAWAEWAAGTSLSRFFPDVDLAKLDSQHFWDQMDDVTIESLQLIEADLTRVVVKELKIELDTLFYDTTNFFTYIASTNAKPKLAQRGKSKQKRTDLRLFGLALLVSRDGNIPLCSQVYEGNRADAKLFPDVLTRIRKRLAELTGDVKELTVVYDRGNMSKVNQALVDESDFGYVAALTPAHHPELMAIPLDQYQPLADHGSLAKTPALRLTRKIWGAERTVVLSISEKLREGQTRGLDQHLKKRLQVLADWKERLKKPKSGPHSPAAAQKQIDQILQGQHIRDVLRIEFNSEALGAERLTYRVDDEARKKLETETFGRRIVVTNRDAWTTAEILSAYRGQSHVEQAFRQSKDNEHLAVRPQYHWTDQKIHVHAFICLLALLLARVVEREARRQGHKEELSTLLETLAGIRLSMVLRPSSEKGGRPRTEWQLEQHDPEVGSFFRSLVPAKAPFVYTDGNG